MMARLAFVFAILFAPPALAAKVFPIPWRITTDPITLSGTAYVPWAPGCPFSACETKLGPFEGSGSWQIEDGSGQVIGSGSVQVTLSDRLIRISNTGALQGEWSPFLQIHGSLEIEIDVPDLGEAMTPLVFRPEAELNQFSGTGTNLSCPTCIFGMAWTGINPADRYESSVVGTSVVFPGSHGEGGGGVSSAWNDTTSSSNLDAGVVAFVAGDRIRIPLDVYIGAELGSGGCPSCSITWSQTLVLRPSAIAPEPQRRPQPSKSRGERAAHQR